MKTRKVHLVLRCFLIIGLFFLSLPIKAQIDFSGNHNLLVEYEVFHNFSLRYENSILVKDHFLVLGYVGVSSNLFLFSKNNYKSFGIPIGLNMIFGKSKHHVESSLGYLWENHARQLDFSSRSYQANYYQLKLGYRYQKIKDSGLILKIGFAASLEGKSNEPRDVVYSRIIDKLLLGPYIGFGYGF